MIFPEFESNDLRDLGERFSPQPFGNLGQAETFRIGEPDSAFDLTAQDSVLRHQILISGLEFLVPAVLLDPPRPAKIAASNNRVRRTSPRR